MLNPRIYVKAAKLIANSQMIFSCNAIIYVAEGDNFLGYYLNNYSKLMQPSLKRRKKIWFGDKFSDQSRLERSLALLFTAEILKDEQKG